MGVSTLMLKTLNGKRLDRIFFEQPTVKVARELLGKYLIINQNKHFQIGQIIETEAYVGEEDRASHAWRGETARNKIMWGESGRLYVYLIYGMYYCLNIVTERTGFPAAVLIRGLEPVFGISGKVDGPGKLCRELGITTKDTGIDITKSNKIYIEDTGEKPKRVIAVERVGIDYAGEWARKKWRFLVLK
jgi:DNA-3-methyladenine glycosylase